MKNNLDDQLGQHERRILISTLRRLDGNQARAAAILGISQRSMWYRVRKYRIKIKKTKGAEVL